jgi:hypothetical protein
VNNRAHRGLVRDIRLDKRDTCVGCRLLDVEQAAGIGQLVDDDERWWVWASA